MRAAARTTLVRGPSVPCSKRDQVAAVVGVERDEVIFTSGATEANNLAILGLIAHAEKSGAPPCHQYADRTQGGAGTSGCSRSRGFDVTLLPPTSGMGRSGSAGLGPAARHLAVSVMHANETGELQPLSDLCAVLGSP